MADEVKSRFLNALKEKCGLLRKLDRSLSLYVIGDDAIRIYIRYSKVHNNHRTFYGLREEDLRQLEGYPSVICFLWNGQKEPLFLRFSDYEEVFRSTLPAADGQYKAQIYLRDGATELYIAQAGRFNVEGSIGWGELETMLSSAAIKVVPPFTHSQVQTLIGAIGAAKGYNIWIPTCDRGKLSRSENIL